jgi:DNA/RNA-binding domain of Phe-tRNA-synthetase-like protein
MIDVMSPDGELRLGFARGAEDFVPFSGGLLEHPVPGEVIFTYNAAIPCRRWTWQGEFSAQRTTTAAVIVDGLPSVTRAVVGQQRLSTLAACTAATRRRKRRC